MAKCELCNQSITNARDENTKVCMDCFLKLNKLGWFKLKHTIEDV